MKKLGNIWLLLLLSIIPYGVYACAACEAQQPALFKGITHGPGPQGNLDFVIVTIATAILLVTLVLAVKFIFKPGEKNPGHIKNMILE